MDFLTVTAIAFGLSFDTFAASLSIGILSNRIRFSGAAKIAFVMAFFQGGLTIAGYFLGFILSKVIGAYDHWVALGILVFIGTRMIIDGFKDKEVPVNRNYTKSTGLLLIAFGTSVDAGAVGISFAMLEGNIWFAGIIIGAITFLASIIAIRIGKSAGRIAGKKTEIVGGLILVAIGIKIFLEHSLS
ncbi:MAG TPA: manganese efflux pump MntP family protein [Bacteroidales bacterium]|nr:manganese efflux pump [Bacteroidales bacterium]HOU96087.1 manganese efflux pump MntP family protein [Bacteroidales bacterium]HQG36669.1 manganese efflux pump MntP family protein [Bacteroidales bacterium]HQG52188.1 manganese efflux pump MntP family protein [Bacteroidales bacterium]HQJ19974.1 manganese efflux pump MntP family protein [Bacteroidales bacterium]